MFFLFQAEDGIRYLVRSRGLGDVYKRQGFAPDTVVQQIADAAGVPAQRVYEIMLAEDSGKAVSYTHLTLPTSDLV